MEGAPATPGLDPLRLDLAAIHQALRAGKGDDAWMHEWLRSSWAAPERFVAAMYAFAASRRGAPKTRPGEGVDLHHDCVTAHLGRRKTALAAREDGAWEEVTYEALHARAAGLAAAWARAGATAGEVLCIVAPVGVAYAAAILAGFRLGMVVAVVPPVGPAYVRARLLAIAPDRVAAGGRIKAMTAGFAADALSLDAPLREAGAPPSHVYAPDAPAMRLVSPMRDEAPRAFDLPAGRVHRALLRDGLFVYALDAADVVAAPGFDPAQHQPQLLLTTLMAGATWAEIEGRDAEVDPRALESAITVLGVRRALRAQLLARGIDPVRGCRAWFRSLSEVLDVGVWDDLGRLFADRKIPGFQVLANAATCGAVLFGPRRLGALGLASWPVPGEAWQLSEVAAGALPALNDSGVLTMLVDGEEDTSLARFVLGRTGDAFTFAGSVDIGPDAQAYPCRELAAAAEAHPAVRHAAAIVVAGRWVNDAKIVLLAFTEPTRDADGALVPAVLPDEIRPLLVRELGEGRLPSRIEVFPLRPRMAGTEVDVSWCRSQYLSGALLRKSRADLFVSLAELAYIFAGETPPE